MNRDESCVLNTEGENMAMRDQSCVQVGAGEEMSSFLGVKEGFWVFIDSSPIALAVIQLHSVWQTQTWSGYLS